jgi:GTP-binding protein
LINAILGRKIAVVSTTPGRTRQLNFFKINDGFTQSFSEGFVVVDMPGYGFARASAKDMEHWQKTAVEYLMKRPNLKRLFLLIDPIKGLKEADREMINLLSALAVSFQVILTKTDKMNRDDLEKSKAKIVVELAKSPAAHPEIIQTSSLKGYGVHQIQDSIIEILSHL